MYNSLFFVSFLSLIRVLLCAYCKNGQLSHIALYFYYNVRAYAYINILKGPFGRCFSFLLL